MIKSKILNSIENAQKYITLTLVEKINISLTCAMRMRIASITSAHDLGCVSRERETDETSTYLVLEYLRQCSV